MSHAQRFLSDVQQRPNTSQVVITQKPARLAQHAREVRVAIKPGQLNLLGNNFEAFENSHPPTRHARRPWSKAPHAASSSGLASIMSAGLATLICLAASDSKACRALATSRIASGCGCKAARST